MDIIAKLQKISNYGEKITFDSNFIIGYLKSQQDEKQNKILEFSKNLISSEKPKDKNKLD